jgi:pilus assembly protein Flp/PilA
VQQWTSKITTALRRWWSSDQSGQGLAEYALILALIAVIAIAALLFMGSQVSDKLSVIGSNLDGVTP